VALAASLILAFAASDLLNATEQATPPSFVSIGQLVAGPYAPVLEVLALVLAAAVLGAMMLAKIEGGSGTSRREEEEGGIQK
jgi:NADH:ubiquinone oxidoreductase subunit 6 (subunit J)